MTMNNTLFEKCSISIFCVNSVYTKFFIYLNVQICLEINLEINCFKLKFLNKNAFTLIELPLDYHFTN